MNGFGQLLLAVWDEFKTLMFINLIPSWDENTRSVQSYSKAYQKREKARRELRSSISLANRKSDEEHGREKWSKPSKIEAWQFGLAVLTFIVGLCLALIYFYQMQANRRQADAAEKQLGEMHQDFIADQRAWVGVDHAGIVLPYSPEHVGLHVEFVNSGKTPAFVENVEFIVERLDTSSKKASMILDTNMTSGFVISPNHDFVMFVSELKSIGDAEFALLNDKKVEHHFWLKMRYHDIFGNIAHHTDTGFIVTGHAVDTNAEGILIQQVNRGQKMD